MLLVVVDGSELGVEDGVEESLRFPPTLETYSLCVQPSKVVASAPSVPPVPRQLRLQQPLDRHEHVEHCRYQCFCDLLSHLFTVARGSAGEYFSTERCWPPAIGCRCHR